jgi:hypothetical protein
MTPSASLDAAAIHQAHQLYCQLTGQTLRLAFDRERRWFELLRAGYTLADLRPVKSVPNTAMSAPSNSPTSSNPTVSRKTSRSAVCVCARQLHPHRTHHLFYP